MRDLISRQAAIDALHMDTSIIPFKKAREYADATISEIRNRLEKLPSANPRRETTTLRIGRTRNSETMWYECAECGEPVDQEDAFCRRCGRGIIHE